MLSQELSAFHRKLRVEEWDAKAPSPRATRRNDKSHATVLGKTTFNSVANAVPYRSSAVVGGCWPLCEHD